MIHKKDRPIATLDEWFAWAPPKKKEKQWKDGFSAKETARCWLAVRSPALPPEVAAALATNEHFGTVTEWSAEPEVRLHFDALAGEPRNTDLLVHAVDDRGPFLLAVEAKVNESFGQTIAGAIASAEKQKREKRLRSRAVKRIEDLLGALLETSIDAEPEVGELRYQLLTATAGALAAARGAGGARVVLLVQEFDTSEADPALQAKNGRDWEAFVRRLTSGRLRTIQTGRIYGPVSLKPSAAFPTIPPLFVGKVRSIGARS